MSAYLAGQFLKKHCLQKITAVSLIPKEETEGYLSSGSHLHFDGVWHCWLELRMLSEIGASVSNQFLLSEGISRGSMCRIFELRSKTKHSDFQTNNHFSSLFFQQRTPIPQFLKTMKSIWKFSTPFLFIEKIQNKNYNAISQIVGYNLLVLS